MVDPKKNFAVQVGQIQLSGEVLANKQFGTWDLELPHLHGTYAAGRGWTIPFATSDSPAGSRCSNFQPPPTVQGAAAGQPSHFAPDEYWHGHHMYIPGHGDQVLLKRGVNYTDGPKDGQNYPVVTQGLWSLRCLASLANDTSPGKTMGEGFIAVSPDGTEYRFDWFATRQAQTLYKPGNSTFLTTSAESNLSVSADLKTGPNTPNAFTSGLLSRLEVWIMPTRVTDRFGNTVTYTYDAARPWQLKSIQSSDDRHLAIEYVAGTDQISSVSDGTRTWLYSYASGVLDTVTLPDSSTWQLAAAHLLQQKFEVNSSCDTNDILGNPNKPPVATLVHPSGAAGTFTLTPTTHGRSWVPRSCRGSVVSGTSYAYRPRYFSTLSLTHKTISGPGLQNMDWSYSYGTPNANWAPCDSCPETSTTTVTDPNGNLSNYTFGNRYNLTEGQLQKVDVVDAGQGLLRSTATRYRAANAGPYPLWIGSSGQARGDGGMAEVFSPKDQQVITQQGVTFTWQATAFDARARATTVTRSSSLGFSRTETTTYADNRADWTPYVLGLVETVTEGSGKVMLANTYHPTAATLLTNSRFGQLDKTMSYNADGTLATRADALGHVTSFSSYMRSIARTVVYADSTKERAEVNNIGKITSITDPNGYTTSYDYDAMGRISRFTPPDEAGIPWNPTTFDFVPVQSSEFDLVPGHWRRNVTTGNAVTSIYFDALWRPVYTLTRDAADFANTTQLVKQSYDVDGRTTFSSYPTSYGGNVDIGVRNEYDALGRPTFTRADSELGVLVSSNTYGSPFTKTHTDARNNNSTSTFQAFDTPSEDAVIALSAPMGLHVDIPRDVFGKPQSISRSGGGASATRRYVYDQNERLCKTIEPETGAELVDYDAAGNIAWRAPGLALSSLVCDRGSVGGSSKISFTYDAMNRLTNTGYGDGASAISRTYTPDGLPHQVSSGGATWTTTYNRRRLPTTQVLTFGRQDYTLGTGYDANGHVSSLSYPSENNASAQSVAYAPDALGRPTQVGNFATGIHYHPGGAIAGFTYGNGNVHAMAPNLRNLPALSSDAGIVQDRYSYDANGNVASITDEIQNIGSRAFSYDALDRLSVANAPGMWGAASYDYDVLDNIRSSTVGNRTSSYQYGPRNLLDNLSSTTPGFGFSYAYDARGNVIQRGNQAFVFDQGNRLTSAPNRDSYIYDGYGHRVRTTAVDGTVTISVYSPAGQLLTTTRTGGPDPAVSTEYIYLHQHQIAEVKQ